ncbi:MAG: bifunctional oligoribonuclease/PAP phosphatase NrnA, partial [Candidatus Moranbacteria bacterium]|nr:bifunctional oligoribonuclease/PAP phosphatase NrnA [Candidatus Moranbacteria bacterium]
MQRFDKEFRTLAYVISKAERILLFAHSRPDPDTVGANLALEEHLRSLGKQVDIACFNPFPDSLKGLAEKTFLHPDQLDLQKYDVVIGSDSVDRGLDTVMSRFHEKQVIILIDHHPDITLTGDVVIIDPEYSSTSELLYLFFTATDAPISKSMATMLLMGILFDTGGFQHGGVSPQVMEIASELMKKGAPLSKISQTIFTNKNIGAMKLWGKAFEKAKFNKETGMLVTAVTQKDIDECAACAEDIYQVASILSTVPDAKFAMVLSERDHVTVRASLRSMEHHGIDVSAIAHQFGGGGHKLASGFEVPGKIIETKEGFSIA